MRLGIKQLKRIVSVNRAERKPEIPTLESRHTEELFRVEKFYEQRLYGFLRVVESLRGEQKQLKVIENIR